MDAAVLLINPKTPYNVGSAIRACSIFGVPLLRWTGKRITTAEGHRMAGSGLKPGHARLPREERMKDYTNVDWREDTVDVIDWLYHAEMLVPVAVEIREGAESLADFVHPEQALYVFGPEDGSLGRGVLTACHRFVRIPSVTRTPFNLAAAVNIVLYDRHVKAEATSDDPVSVIHTQRREAESRRT